ncbi:class I SAM-dependent methyltransferase [Nonomuraea gerenzanensis]|uniref:SAM-dependent methyltransferase n=1 Tax=Nonomuraea gerenzanensis TaxID=93944 RepID=A0A1M4E0S5_9ACTN|nr:class I SAM-dependent methyltransferase [Nonomuraea gerenzanensis]UBU14705.1 methyltransferase domain-containing protein [Nonomuraea gerenzanensis]SBO92430.1 SAM-dependent methyltransferase [Nonomuraea gerenzanensis]
MGSIVNTEQAAAWNGYEGEHWAAHFDRYDAVNSGFNATLLDAAAIGAGDRVLDLGCGNGQVTRLAARQARHAVGVDLSEPMLARARSVAAAESVANVTFEQGDVQVHPFPEGSFDVAISRFAVMFFGDPVAAFGNVARALRPGGRLAFVTMDDLDGTDLGTIMATLAAHLPGSSWPAPVPDRSGPLSLADPGRVREVLTRAGFANVTVTRVEALANWGENAAAAADFFSGWGPVRHHLAGADPAPVREALEAAFRSFEDGGAVRLRGTAWLVRADR